MVGPVSITQETVGDPAYLPLCNDLLGMGATHDSEVGLLYLAGSPTKGFLNDRDKRIVTNPMRYV